MFTKSLPIISGFILALSLFDGFEFLVFIGLVPLFVFWSLEQTQLKNYFISGFVAEIIFMGVAFHWIQSAGKSYFLLDSFSSCLFYFIYISVLSMHWGIIGLVFGYFRQFYPKLVVLLMPFFLILLDEIIFRVFPFHFGFHWYAGKFPGVTWAAYIGLSGLGFLVLWLNLFLALILQKREIRISFVGLFSIMIFLVIAPKFSELGQNLEVLGVQGNISNEVKRTDLQVMENQMMTVDRYYRLTRKGMSENPNLKFDLVVWPETALPFVWRDSEYNLRPNTLQSDVLAFSKRINQSILTGSYFDDAGNYNAVIYLTPDEKIQHSQKKYLFPIGEVIPFNDFWGLTKNMFPEVPRFKSERTPLFLKTKSFNTAVPICYEALFSEFFESFQEPIEFIVSISNDGWFESSIQKKWHAIIALGRSLEYLAPVLRVTNDGASGMAEVNGNYRFVEFSKELAFVNSFSIEKKSAKSWMQENGDLVNRAPRILSYILVLLLFLKVLKPLTKKDRD